MLSGRSLDMIKVLVAEDDPLTLEGIKLLLGSTDYRVVATASDGEAVLELLPTQRPDLLLLDFDMPKLSGVEVLRLLRERGDKRPIVLLTGSMSDRRVYEALQVGLDGLVIKSAAPLQLLTCLDIVMQGRRWIDHDILQRAMEISLASDRNDVDRLQVLSNRERSVVDLVRQGMRNRQIAEMLGIGESTVKVHLRSAFAKLKVNSRTELALIATETSD
jgi:two-component system, NarL family, nitrate/nitrite response regulator NarL